MGSHSCFTLVDILKAIPGAEERKKEKEQDGEPSHDGRYADHAVQISPATNLGVRRSLHLVSPCSCVHAERRRPALGDQYHLDHLLLGSWCSPRALYQPH